MQKNTITGIEYTKGNQDTLQSYKRTRGYESDEWLTFLQDREKGLKIKKGSKGVHLVRVFDTDKGELGKEKKAVRYFTVFNLEQCEKIKLGMPLNYDYEKVEKEVAG